MAAINKAAKPQWLSRTLAGTCLGFTLAVALSWIFVRLAPDAAGKVQMAMRLMPPVWLAVASLAFLFRDGWRAAGGQFETVVDGRPQFGRRRQPAVSSCHRLDRGGVRPARRALRHARPRGLRRRRRPSAFAWAASSACRRRSPSAAGCPARRRTPSHGGGGFTTRRFSPASFGRFGAARVPSPPPPSAPPKSAWRRPMSPPPIPPHRQSGGRV